MRCVEQDNEIRKQGENRCCRSPALRVQKRDKIAQLSSMPVSNIQENSIFLTIT